MTQTDAALSARVMPPKEASQPLQVPGVKPSMAVRFSWLHIRPSGERQKFSIRLQSGVCSEPSGNAIEGLTPSSNPGKAWVMVSCWIAPPEPPFPTVHFGTP